MQENKQPSWTISTLNEVVDAELNALPDDMRAHFVRICDLIEESGPMQVGPSHVKHLVGSIWEMRMRGRDGISRALFCIASETPQCVVVVRAFVKKTQKTSSREIKLARTRAKDVNQLK